MLGEVLAGADEQVRAAGAILAGGHTIRDSEPKYGLSVVGTVRPDAIWPKAGSRPGDALFLTKPLGTGIVLQAHRDGMAPEGALDAAVAAMLELEPRRGGRPSSVPAERGHGRHRLRAPRARARARVPKRRPRDPRGGRTAGASRRHSSSRGTACARAATGGTASSRARTSRATPTRRSEALAYDPQTAGGLLVSLPAERGAVLEASFAASGLALTRIGRVEAGSGVVLA